jgi:hypothetical protein
MKRFPDLRLIVCASMLLGMAPLCVLAQIQDPQANATIVLVDDANAFAVSSDATDAATADKLYKINLSTGQASVVGALGVVGGMFEDVEGLAFDVNGNLFGVDDDTKTLLNINPASGRATAVGGVRGNTRLTPSSSNAQDLSIAFSCSGELFAAARNSKTLYRANTATGVFDTVGAGGALAGGIQDIAVANTKMYGLGDDKFYRIDASTGVSEAIGSFGAGIDFKEGGGLAADSTGQLFAIGERRMPNGDLLASQIYKLNVKTGAATLFSSSPLVGVESLAIGAPSCSAALADSPVGVPSLNLIGLMCLMSGLLLLGKRFS